MKPIIKGGEAYTNRVYTYLTTITSHKFRQKIDINTWEKNRPLIGPMHILVRRRCKQINDEFGSGLPWTSV